MRVIRDVSREYIARVAELLYTALRYTVNTEEILQRSRERRNHQIFTDRTESRLGARAFFALREREYPK